jgi:LptD protein
LKKLQKLHIILRIAFILFIFLGLSLKTYAQRPSFDAIRNTGGASGGVGGNQGQPGFGGRTGQNASSNSGSTPKASLKKSRLPKGTVVSVVPDSVRSKENDFDETLEYFAEDSTVMDADGKVMYLYGNAQVLYGDVGLEANYIRVDWGKNELSAHGTKDTTGKAIGKPVFTESGTRYNMDSIRYNFNSKKALIKGIVTQQGDGYLQGAKVKKDSTDNMYFADAKYTTCNLKDPHFHIGAKMIKLVNKKQVVSGPFRLYVADIPLPFIVPFGWFPIPKNKEIGTSGVIMPTYGEEPNGRGFYLRDGGYFFAISEKFNFKVLGQLYSRGSWGLGTQSSYAKKYRYTGNLSLQFNSNKPGDSPFDDRLTARDMNITWSHSPANLRPDRSFSTNVNFVTNGFNQNNARDINAYTQNTFGSSVQYSRSLTNTIKTNLSYRIDQNVRTKVMDTGLDISLNVNQFNPFIPEKKFTGRKFEQFRLGFDFSGGLSTTNNISNSAFTTQDLGYKIKGQVRINPDSVKKYIRFNEESSFTKVLPLKTLEDAKKLLKNGQFRGTFSLPISLPNFKIAKYLNFTPGMSMSGNVFTRQYKFKPNVLYHPEPTLGAKRIKQPLYKNRPIDFLGEDTYNVLNNGLSDTGVDIDTIPGLYFVPNVSFSASLNTRAYGTVYFKKGAKVQAIRHSLVPSISMNFTPNLAENPYYYTKTQVDVGGREMYLARFDNLSPAGKYGSVSFGLTNSLEAKIRSNADSSEKDYEKVSLLDNFTLNGSYNMLADTNKLSDISISANTVLFKKFTINMSGTLNPYHYAKDKYNATNYTGLKTKDFRINKGEGLAQLSNAYLSIGTSFKPKGKDKPKEAGKNVSKEQADFINKNPDLYVDFDIPWSLMLNYSFNYSKFGLAKQQTTQMLNVNGDLSLTPKWKVGFNSGWDFSYKELTITTFSVARELHCWDMNFSWTPKAAAGSLRAGNYDITIRARGSIMQDLKLSRRRSFYDRGGF